MDEKKLTDEVVAKNAITDEEYVKILKHCTGLQTCKNCEYNEGCPLDNETTVAVIHRLQDEKERLREEKWKAQDDLDCYHTEYQELEKKNAEQKAEIERLKEFLSTFETVVSQQQEQIEKKVEELYPEFMREYKLTKNDLKESLEREAELQKQVDELTEENAQLSEMADYDKGHKEGYEHGYNQAVKDTAKEILQEVLSLCKNSKEKLSIMFANKTSGYGEGYKNSVAHFTEYILKIAKEKGVEVE